MLYCCMCCPPFTNGDICGANLLYSLFWLILFGIYGKLYIPEDCEGSSACGRMKTAVWFDMLGMILWFFSTISEYHSRLGHTTIC